VKTHNKQLRVGGMALVIRCKNNPDIIGMEVVIKQLGVRTFRSSGETKPAAQVTFKQPMRWANGRLSTTGWIPQSHLMPLDPEPPEEQTPTVVALPKETIPF